MSDEDNGQNNGQDQTEATGDDAAAQAQQDQAAAAPEGEQPALIPAETDEDDKTPPPAAEKPEKKFSKKGKPVESERDPTLEDLEAAADDAIIPVIWCFPGNPNYAIGHLYPVSKGEAHGAIMAGRARLATLAEIKRHADAEG